MGAPTNVLSVYQSGYGSTNAGPGVGVLLENLMPMIMSIKPWDHPFFTMATKIRAQSTTVEWITDEYGDATYAGEVEGDDWSGEANTSPTRVINFTQIFRSDFSVTDTVSEVALHGIRDPYQYRLFQATKALAKAVEKRIFDIAVDPSYGGAATSAATGRRFKPLEALLDAAMVVDASNSTLGIDEVDSAMELAFDAGIEPTMLMVSSGVKADFSKSANETGAANWPWNVRGIDAAEKKIIRGVTMYDSEFGLISVVPNRSIAQTSATTGHGWAWLIDKEQVAIAMLRDIRHKPMGAVGDSQKGIVRGELSLILRTPKGAAAVKRVTT